MKPVGSPEGPLLPERWGGAIPAACEPQAAPASVGSSTREKPPRGAQGHADGGASPQVSPGWKGSGGLYSSQAHTFPAVLDDAAARGGHAAAGHCRTCWCCSGSRFCVGLLRSQFSLFLLRLPVPCGAAHIPVPSIPAQAPGSRLFLLRLPVPSIPVQAPGSLCPCSDPGSLPCQLDVAVPRVGACADRWQCRQLVSASSWSVPGSPRTLLRTFRHKE